MHQKILIIDGIQTWIGSANMTGESLRRHGNLVVGIQNRALAERALEKAESMKFSDKNPFYHQSYLLGAQTMEVWYLPDDPLATKRILDLLHAAKKKIRIAMFTWTRKDFAEAVIEAKRRGVDVEVVIDQNSGRGAGAEVVSLLSRAGVPVSLSQGTALLHHKMLVIDDKILVNGSANWTRAAFTRNDDCFIILHDLTEEQIKKLRSLWEIISLEAVPELEFAA